MQTSSSAIERIVEVRKIFPRNISHESRWKQCGTRAIIYAYIFLPLSVVAQKSLAKLGNSDENRRKRLKELVKAGTIEADVLTAWEWIQKRCPGAILGPLFFYVYTGCLPISKYQKWPHDIF